MRLRGAGEAVFIEYCARAAPVNIVGRGFARDAFAQALSAEAFVSAMLDFERALADAEADAGLIPHEAARVIATACTELRLSAEALAAESKRSGSLAVPLVKALTDHVARVDARARQPSCTTARPARTSSTPRWSCA